jgi:hypothetical protein
MKPYALPLLVALYVSTVIFLRVPLEKPLGFLLLVTIPVLGLSVAIVVLGRSWVKTTSEKRHPPFQL